MEQEQSDINIQHAAHALSQCITLETVAGNTAAFEEMHAVLCRSFPLIFQQAHIQRVNTHAMLLSLQGSRAEQPLLFIGHMDVVPVSQGSSDEWVYPPFSGMVAEAFVWGRGAIDMKGHLIALLEALEGLLQSGFQPVRDILIALSADEEIRGTDASSMFRILKARGVRPVFVLDEGMGIMEGRWGMTKPMAMIGVGEKGFANLTITASSTGGHCAYPPTITALEKAIRAAANVTRLPLGMKHVSPALAHMLAALVPHLPKGFRRFAFARAGLFRSYVISLFEKDDFDRAFLMTTVALTAARGSAALNALPEKASITINCRLIQGDNVNRLKKRVMARIKHDDVQIDATELADPSRVSPASGAPWNALVTAIAIHYPGAVPLPTLVLGASDARRYEGLCDHIYRFSPFMLPPDELKSKHGINERLSLENLEIGIQFFRQMLQV